MRSIPTIPLWTRGEGGEDPQQVLALMRSAFEAHVRRGEPVSCVALEVDGIERVMRRAGDGRMRQLLTSVREALRAAPRPDEIYLLRDGRKLVALFPGMDEEGAQRVVRHLLERGRSLSFAHGADVFSIGLSIGLAYTQPGMELFLEALLAVADDGVEVSSRSGGDRASHSQLYALHQNRLRRERPDERPPRYDSEALAREEAAREAERLRRRDEKERREQSSLAQSDEQRREAALAAELAAAEAELAERVRVDLEQAVAAAQADDPDALQRRVLDLALETARREIESALSQRMREHRRQVEQLQRRIAKLSHSLEHSEQDLERVATMRTLDHGVASAFRTVQGLSDSEDDYELKRELMGRIFEQNLLLMSRTLEA